MRSRLAGPSHGGTPGRPRRSRGAAAAPRVAPSVATVAPRGLVVRRATPADAPMVAALRAALRREAEPGPSRPRRPPPATGLPTGRRNEVVLLAVRDGRPAGILRCTAVRSESGGYAYVSSAYVLPAERRRGVLRSLLAAAESWCRARRLDEMRLHCRVENRGGAATWRACGFVASRLLFRRTLSRS